MYVMEPHVVIKGKPGKRARATEDLTMRKKPTKISLDLTYSQFLTNIAKALDVELSQLDCENMRWKFRKPASSPPTNISDNQSYDIMIQAIQPRKEPDRWIIHQETKSRYTIEDILHRFCRAL
jgi:hypothetical protein